MLRILLKLVPLLLCGCGAGLPESLPVGFLNETRHSDEQLWTIWKTAQQILSQRVHLNPLQHSMSGAKADIHPGDSRALQVMPHQLLVSPEVDVSSSTLFAATGTYRADPTGMIACPQPCNVRYAAAYSWYQRHTTRYAGSWERQGDNFSFILEYEFEKHILAALGYSLKWRSQQTNYLFSLLVLSDFDELSLAELSLFAFPSFFEAESPFDALAPPDFLA